MANHADFLKAALQEFPALQVDLELADGLPHLEMHAYTRFTQRAKGDADWHTYRRAVYLAAKFLREADDALRNEFMVSYLEHLDFDGPRGEVAWSQLPPDLQRAWHEIVGYNERLLGRPWGGTKRKVIE